MQQFRADWNEFEASTCLRIVRRWPAIAAGVLILLTTGGVVRSGEDVGGDSRLESADTPSSQRVARTEAADKEHPLKKALELAEQSAQALDQITDFEATFSKREVVGQRVVPHTMHIKHRAEPFSVYLRFHPPHVGREVLYVEGQNDGNLIVRESGIKGLVGAIALSPTSPAALSESRHPITKIGLVNMLQGVIEQWKSELKYGEIDVQYFPNAMWGELQCLVIESSHPQPRRQFQFHKTLLYLDKTSKLPVRLQQYGFPPRPGLPAPLMEDYAYTDVKTNLGLTDLDFDVANPDYNF